jgi:tyrosine-protein phosphatase non-receptor type 11
MHAYVGGERHQRHLSVLSTIYTPAFHMWFHPHLKGPEAEKLLRETGVDGSFLVRPSKSNPGDFTLSVRRGDEVTHVKIQNTGDCYDLYGGEMFATLSELVQFYTENEGQLKEKSGELINLRHPVVCEDPTTERWFHGPLSGKESEQLLIEQGTDGSFLVRASQSKPGDFALTVRCGDRVTHIIIRNQGGLYDVGGGEQFKDLSSLVENFRKSPMVETSGNVVHLKQPFNATRVSLASIAARVQELSKKSKDSIGFAEEFEQLQQMEYKQMAQRKEGQRPENKTKNRYKNILPYDDTRVKLVEVGSAVGADYINANFIRPVLPDGRDSNAPMYIASQGCLKSTCAAFWQMIWEQNSRVIVMTTLIVERGKKKCEQYWPETPDSPPISYGPFNVAFISKSEDPSSTTRILQVWKGDSPRREIMQFHFTAWPDHGVPDDPNDVLGFLLRVKQHMKLLPESVPRLGPMIVHCSAGIGRTGTFIVIDMLLENIALYGLNCDIDIQKTIQNVRLQRSGMIQTVAQYQFVYDAIVFHITALKAKQGGGPLLPQRKA